MEHTKNTSRSAFKKIKKEQENQELGITCILETEKITWLEIDIFIDKQIEIINKRELRKITLYKPLKHSYKILERIRQRLQKWLTAIFSLSYTFDL